MGDSVKVSVVKYPDREHLVLRWRDPITGKPRCKTSGTTRRRDAERAAGKLEKEISEGQHGPAARMNWPEFRHYHETHCLRALKDRTGDAYNCALNVFERFHKPERLTDITAARVTAWQTQLRTEGKSESTIATYTRHLKAMLRWAHSQGLLAVVPKIVMPKRAKGGKVMKGRPITLEEFERMLAAVPKAIEARPTTDGVDTVTPWRFYLRGLWASGLRLSESLSLRWDAKPGALVVDFSGRRPMMRIPAESEKGGQDRLLPIAPEFAELLDETPESERHGRVFMLIGSRLAVARMQADWVSRVVCRIGCKAGVKVDERERRLVVDSRVSKAAEKPSKRKGRKRDAEPDDGIKRKYASAHDLRRAFGLRWSARVMPAVLQQLMRHEDISTTMKYYVGRDADAVADVLWGAVESSEGKPESNKSGNKRPATGRRAKNKKPQHLAG
jgi:integrase